MLTRLSLAILLALLLQPAEAGSQSMTLPMFAVLASETVEAEAEKDPTAKKFIFSPSQNCGTSFAYTEAQLKGGQSRQVKLCHSPDNDSQTKKPLTEKTSS